VNDRTPAEAFPPGELLNDELTARGWNQTEFAEIIGRPTRVVNEIIAGKRGISPETAKEIAAALGTSAQLWMNLEATYQLSKTAPAPERISRRAKLREKFPIREMIRRGWLRASSSDDEMEAKVLEFFCLTSLEGLIAFPHAARRNYSEPLSVLQQAWLFRVRQIATSMSVPAYSQDALRASLGRLEKLTVVPEEAAHIGSVLSECGVRFVVVEQIPGSKIDGVCLWLNCESPVIGMTLRFDRNDNFWFVLRHEIEHVLHCHGRCEVVIDEDVGSAQSEEHPDEQIANTAAEKFCAPGLDLFIKAVSPYFSQEKVVKFAMKVQRHPGIVVGQLQRRVGRPDLLNKLKAKIRSHVIAGAITDGWGSAPVE
jgi:HTH-type transcriptional regulator/antitoxin HigA